MAINQNDPNLLNEEEVNPMDQVVQTDMPLFFGNVQTPEQNEFIDNVLALPRGFGKSAARMVAAEIPEGLFPEAVTEIFANKAFEVKQGAAENYSTFNSYQDYIENVLVPSVPFYISSPFRERIFKSESAQWSPSYEFPF